MAKLKISNKIFVIWNFHTIDLFRNVWFIYESINPPLAVLADWVVKDLPAPEPAPAPASGSNMDLSYDVVSVNVMISLLIR